MIDREMVTFVTLMHDVVDAADPIDIYEKIRRHVRDQEVDHAVMDVTGGKKVMSASAALAASELGIPLCYIAGAATRTRHGAIDSAAQPQHLSS